MFKKLDQQHTHRSFAMPVMLYDIAKAKVKALKYKKIQNMKQMWCLVGGKRVERFSACDITD